MTPELGVQAIANEGCGVLNYAKGWLVRRESGTYVRFTEAGAALFA